MNIPNLELFPYRVLKELSRTAFPIIVPVILQWILRTHQNHLLQCHLGIQACLETFDTEFPTTNSQDDKYPSMTRNELFLFLASSITSFFVSDFCQLPCRDFLQFFPFFLHCCLCIWNLSLLAASEWICERDCSESNSSLLLDVILMRDVSSSFYPWSGALAGINNRSTSCRAFPNIAVGLPNASFRYFAWHCCWHPNFQLSSSGFDYELEFFIIWFGEVHSSQLSGIIAFWFLHCAFLFCFLLGCIGHIFPHIWPHIVRTRSFFVSS